MRRRKVDGTARDGSKSPELSELDDEYELLADHSEEEDEDSSYATTSFDEGLGKAKRIAAKKKSMNAQEHGVTLDGLRLFELPETHSHLQSLLLAWHSPTSLVAYSGILFSLLTFYLNPERPYVLLFVAVFWRVAYNLGIGLLLKWQSEDYFLTNFVAECRRNPFSSENSFLGFVLRRTMPGDRDVLDDQSLPASFPAWIMFRALVNIVETNDVFAFTLMAIQYGIIERGEYSGSTGFLTKILSPLADIVGSLLICLSVYSKFAARKTAGDYAWYWGDFFFLKAGSVELTFDSIFELFPHPMYTIGYGWTYGCALLARSFEVLACAAGFHLSQMLFLALVETPHVDRLYGDIGEEAAEEIAATLGPKASNGNAELQKQAPPLETLIRAKSDGDTTMLPSTSSKYPSFGETERANVFVIKNFDPFRASDVNLLLTVVFYVFGIYMGSMNGGPLSDDGFFIGQALFWRVFATVVMAVVLVRQEKTKFWTRHFTKLGMSKTVAFDSWKRLYNLIQSMQHIGFILCCTRLMSIPETIMDPAYISQMFLGTILVIVSIWSFQSCYEVLGDYGWFYGDFFIPPPMKHNTLMSRPSYQGIYRYLNNPDAYLGHLWLYGFSLICRSPQLFAVALLSHTMKIAFLQTVEKPHFRSLYKHTARKSSTALGRAIRGKVKDIKRNETAIFLANWVKHPIETGALAPSSEQLAVAMCDTMYLGDDSVVVELGPGTGPFTKEILKRLEDKRNTVYLGFELSEEFVKRLRSTFPEIKDNILCESAERIVPVLRDRNLAHADTIISGLPWAIFPKELQRSILKQVYDALKPGGRFCTFAYLQGLVLPAGQNFKALLDEMFDKVERSPIVWKNLPPAFVYRCQKNE